MMNGMMGKCGRWFHHKSAGLLLLRLALGAFFIGHGVAKLQGMDVTIQLFQQWGFAIFWAYVVSWVEVLGGSAFVLGAFMWIAAPLIAIEMLVAIYVVTGPNPQNQPALLHYIFGWGPGLIYAAAALCLAWCGAGRWSLTGLWMRKKGGACRDCKADHGMGHNCPDCSMHEKTEPSDTGN